MSKKLKAYTLIELLVVMSIISFIVAGSWAALRYGLKKSRDLQREKALRMLQSAVEAYYSDYGAYPECQGGTSNVSGNDGNTYQACPLENLAANKDFEYYLDAPFKSPLPGLRSTEGAMAYYINTETQYYALCTLTELKHKTGDHINYYSPPGCNNQANCGNNTLGFGCFCLGPAADAIQCAGLTTVQGTPTQ